MGPFPAKANIWKLVLQDNAYLNAKNVMLIPLILERTHVIYLCTRVCVEYPTIYANIQGHPTHSNCHTYICILKRTYTFTLKALRQNLH